jgi:hypothetical protein
MMFRNFFYSCLQTIFCHFKVLTNLLLPEIGSYFTVYSCRVLGNQLIGYVLKIVCKIVIY